MNLKTELKNTKCFNDAPKTLKLSEIAKIIEDLKTKFTKNRNN